MTTLCKTDECKNDCCIGKRTATTINECGDLSPASDSCKNNNKLRSVCTTNMKVEIQNAKDEYGYVLNASSWNEPPGTSVGFDVDEKTCQTLCRNNKFGDGSPLDGLCSGAIYSRLDSKDNAIPLKLSDAKRYCDRVQNCYGFIRKNVRGAENVNNVALTLFYGKPKGETGQNPLSPDIWSSYNKLGVNNYQVKYFIKTESDEIVAYRVGVCQTIPISYGQVGFVPKNGIKTWVNPAVGSVCSRACNIDNPEGNPDWCKNAVKDACGEGNGYFGNPYCQDFCALKDVNCDNELKKYCANKGEERFDYKKYPECACFQPPEWYLKVQEELKKKYHIQFTDSRPACWFDKCGIFPVKDQQYKNGKQCPPIQNCINIINIEGNDTSGAEIYINPDIKCQMIVDETTQCGEDYYRDQNDSKCKKCPNGTIINKNKTGCISTECKYDELFDKTDLKCIPCPAGNLPDKDKKICIPEAVCFDRNYLDVKTNTCKPCTDGMIPTKDRRSCEIAEKCDGNRYKDVDNICKDCPENTIVDNTGLSCVSTTCSSDEIFDMKTKSCQRCGNGFMPDPAQRICVPIPDTGCKTDEYKASDGKCRKCEAGYKLNPTKTGCVKIPNVKDINEYISKYSTLPVNIDIDKVKSNANKISNNVLKFNKCTFDTQSAFKCVDELVSQCNNNGVDSSYNIDCNTIRKEDKKKNIGIILSIVGVIIILALLSSLFGGKKK